MQRQRTPRPEDGAGAYLRNRKPSGQAQADLPSSSCSRTKRIDEPSHSSQWLGVSCDVNMNHRLWTLQVCCNKKLQGRIATPPMYDNYTCHCTSMTGQLQLLAHLPNTRQTRDQVCCKPGEPSNGLLVPLCYPCAIAATLDRCMASHAQTVSNINSVLINFQVQLSAEPLVWQTIRIRLCRQVQLRRAAIGWL